MRHAFLLILLLAGLAAGQSGRVKPGESPTPKPRVPAGGYVPTTSDRPRVAEPTPTPRATPDDSEITVESTLVPIPATVLRWVWPAGSVHAVLVLEDFSAQ